MWGSCEHSFSPACLARARQFVKVDIWRYRGKMHHGLDNASLTLRSQAPNQLWETYKRLSFLLWNGAQQRPRISIWSVNEMLVRDIRHSSLENPNTIRQACPVQETPSFHCYNKKNNMEILLSSQNQKRFTFSFCRWNDKTQAMNCNVDNEVRKNQTLVEIPSNHRELITMIRS